MNPCSSLQRVCLVSVLLLLLLCSLSPTQALPASQRWGWPTRTPVTVVEGFDPPAHNWLPGRRGLQLDYGEGQPVYASADGEVIYAGVLAGRGVISIAHKYQDARISSTYLPVHAVVHAGEHVSKGQLIGVVEDGSSTLHWGAKRGRGNYVNPIRLTLAPPRLYPWGEGP